MRSGRGRQVIGSFLRNGRPVGVQAYDWPLAPQQVSRNRGFADDDRGRRIIDHEAQALRWIGRIERHVGAAALQHAQQRDDRRRGALQADPHAHLRADALPAQVPSQPVGGLIQLSIGQSLVGVRHGDRVRRLSRLVFEALGKEKGAGLRAHRTGGGKHQMSLLFGLHREP